MLRSLRESLALVLIALLPFHAFLVTVLTKIIAGQGHRPLAGLALWKEALLGFILCTAIVETLRNGKWTLLRPAFASATAGKQGYGGQEMGNGKLPHLDRIDVLILLLSVVAFVVSIFNFPVFAPMRGAMAGRQFSMFNFALGAKYDFLPLLAFIILRRVEWSGWWRSSVMNVLIVDGVILSVYGIATLFLPMGFFTALGYSDLHSLYLPDGPLAAFQQLGGSGIRRVQSAMSGPNQLGIWLLIPLGVLLADFYSKKVSSFPPSLKLRGASPPSLKLRGASPPSLKLRGASRFQVSSFPPSLKLRWASRFQVSSLILLACLVATFSRAAWIAAIAMAFVAWFPQSKPVFRLGGFLQGTGIILSTITAVALLTPSVFLRLQSTSDHLRRPIEALSIIRQHPFGLGLGSAGPASNAVSDTCVDLPEGADGSWAGNRSDLCVFIGVTQVQPVDRSCDCPLLTENWYLQWGVELGVIGLVLYLALVFLILRQLAIGNWQSKQGLIAHSSQLIPFLVFLGLSIAALFLHAFEDSAVAYTAWMLVAVALKPEFKTCVRDKTEYYRAI